MEPSELLRPIDDLLKYFRLEHLIKYDIYFAIVFYLLAVLIAKIIYNRIKVTRWRS